MMQMHDNADLAVLMQLSPRPLVNRDVKKSITVPKVGELSSLLLLLESPTMFDEGTMLLLYGCSPCECL